MNNRFSIKQALWFGFSTVIDHFAFFIALMLSYLGIIVFGSFIGLAILCLPFSYNIVQIGKTLNTIGLTNSEVVKDFLTSSGPAFTVCLSVLILLIYFLYRLLSLGMVKIALDFYDNGESKIQKIFSCWRLVVRDVVATSLYWLMCAIGFSLLIVPGVYIAITFGFYQYAIVDEDAGVFDSFKRSAQLTSGYKMDLFGLMFLMGIIKWAALSLFGIALIIVVPAFALIYAYVYRKLLARV